MADTLEALHDGLWLSMLIYAGEFSRHDARLRVREYLATTFPGHFQMPNREVPSRPGSRPIP